MVRLVVVESIHPDLNHMFNVIVTYL
jgi:hypothetical protein